MSTVKKILVPFDFLEASYNALDYAMNFVGYDKPISIMALWVSEVKPTEHELEELYSRFTSTLNEIQLLYFLLQFHITIVTIQTAAAKQYDSAPR